MFLCPNRFRIRVPGPGIRKDGTRYAIPGNRTRGAVLVVTLWIVSILAIFGVGLSRLAWSSYYFSRWQSNMFFSRIIADSVLLLCKADRKKDVTTSYDILSELLNGETFECGDFIGKYSMVDEERWLNINNMPRDMIEELPSMNRSKSKEIYEYREKPFYPLTEILLVDEIDRETYEKIKPLVTVYGSGKVNINTCSEEILERLGVSDSTIKDIMDFRKGYDGVLFTDDDGAFENVHNITTVLKDEYQISMKAQQMLLSLIGKGMLCVKSSNFRIKLDVYRSDRLISNYSIVIGQDRRGKNWRVKEWKKM